MTNLNGVNLYYEVTGRGEPLLLVHGSWGDHHEYDQVVSPLAAQFRVVTYDRRGHSASGPAAGSVRDDIADAAALIEHLELGPTHVFGACSFVPLWLAARRPDLVRTAAVHEPALFSLLPDGAPEPPAAEKLAVELIRAERHEEAARTFFEQIVMGPGGWAFLPPPARDAFITNAPTFAEERRDPDSATIDVEALAASRVPVLITHGHDGDPVFRAVADHIAAAVPSTTVKELLGGHAPHITHASQFLITFIDWLHHARINACG
jgi:pimeloyl-ACP methyl ester carboxylesterase